MSKNKNQQPDKMDGKSKDVWSEKLEKLQQQFPEVLSENKVDCDQLKKLVGDENVEEGERYQFSWAGKSKVFQEIKRRTTKTLKPERDESVNFDDTDNIFIEGENLEVLKVLQKSYYGKVKMIYIDPPYNTGNNFVYNDDFKRSREEEEKESGNLDKEGNLKKGLVKNTKTGRYHSNWLNMMYPRLYLARNLLKEDGVIFVSIDDNEVHNLRMVMNEIFGEENFVLQISANRASEIASNNTISKHEYVLVYSKNNSKFKVDGKEKYTLSRGTVGNEDQTMPVIEFPKGLQCKGVEDGIYKETRKIEDSKENIENIDSIVVSDGKLAESVRLKARWRSSNDMRNFFDNDCEPTEAKISGVIEEIYLEGDRFMPKIKKKTFVKIPSLILDIVRGSKDLEELGLKNCYDFPKSVDFIKKLISYIDLDSGDTVLDFFAGSASTAQAVMEQNAEDGGNRKYIMVQLPEETDEDSEARKAGYKNIANIAKARISKSGENIEKEVGEIHATMKYMQEEQGEPSRNIKEYFSDVKGLKYKGDTGFKVFKLSDSNFKQWIREEVESEDKLQQKLEDAIDNLDEDVEKKNILFELMLKLGINPNVEIKNKQNYFVLKEEEYVICLEEKMTKGIVDEILEEEPHVAVCLDSAFDGNDELKANTALQMKSKDIEFKVV